MVNSVLMFDALGLSAGRPDASVRARASIERLLVVKEDEAYCQPCLSPVWDTALAAHALLEVGGAECERRAVASLDWLKPLQVLDTVGDWAATRPDVRPGGWAFQYANPHYPDLDDTAVVVMAMDRASARMPDERARHIRRGDGARAANGSIGLQSTNGGWGAFDADNDYYYLNQIPFSDHGALLDPPTADVTARCVSMLAQLGETRGQERARSTAAIAYLLRHAGEGRQLVRPLGHELHLRHLVGALRAQRRRRRSASPAVRKAVDWLLSIQNDGRRLGRGRRRATSSTTKATSPRRARPRRPPGRCSA